MRRNKENLKDGEIMQKINVTKEKLLVIFDKLLEFGDAIDSMNPNVKETVENKELARERGEWIKKQLQDMETVELVSVMYYSIREAAQHYRALIQQWYKFSLNDAQKVKFEKYARLAKEASELKDAMMRSLSSEDVDALKQALGIHKT